MAQRLSDAFDSFGAESIPYRFDVQTSKAQLSPAKLRGVSMVADCGEEHDSVMAPQPETTKVLLDCINIMDSGSATTLAGKEEAAAWIRAGVATSVAPRETSVQHIRGIGAISRVRMWLKFVLDIGGALVTFHDVPVLDGHRGLLLGNDFLGPGRVDLAYDSARSGTLTIRDELLIPRSLPVQFDITGDDGLSFASEAYSVAGDFGSTTPEQRQEFAKQQSDASQVEEALRGVDPIGWVPETTVVPAWSERDIWIRVPETLVKARDVLLLPLEDERRTDPGVLIAPSLQRVSKEGYARCRVINMHKQDKRLPLLTPLVRFQVDPRVYNISYEYTVDEIVDQIHVGSTLSEDERSKIHKMLSTRRALFRSTLGYAHPYKAKLKLRGIEHGLAKPPNAPLRVRSLPEEEALDAEVAKNLKAGLIEPARSPFNAMPMLVEKPTKEGQPKQWRTVIDYRSINQLLEKDVYPLPNLEVNLARLGKANWYTTVDLLSGFWQVELEDDGISKEATSFSTRAGQFQWVRMPMGLASSPSTFMRLVDATLNGLPPGICLAYVDDIIIPTCGSFDDHMRDVGMVFDRLIESGFAVRCDKTHIGLTEVPHLGFMCGPYGTRPLAEKTQALFDLAVEDMWGNPSAAARYAGMLGFYSRFIPDLQQLLAPFSDLKAKAAPTDHILGRKGATSTPPSLRFLASFAATRAALANVTALARPDNSKPFEIHVDAASSCGIGAALMQRVQDDDPDSLRPIAFWSRRLQDEERGYDVREQECLALDQTLKKWRHYLLGAEIKLLSDHSSLQWLLTSPHPDGSRVAGWALNAQAYNLTISWISGKKNVVADCLSRAAKSDAKVLEMGASGENERSIVERLEDTLWANVAAAFTTVHYQACESPRPTSKLQQWACGICRVNHHVFNIQRYWRGYSIRKCNAVRVLSPYRRVARSSPAQRNETNIFEGRGGTSRMRIDLSTPDGPRVESQATTTLTPPQLAHLSSRVALVLLRQGPSGLQVAVEECEGELVLPSTAVSPTDTLCYRGQLSRMLCNMNIPSAVLDALPYASSFRARNSILPRCQFFVQLVCTTTEFSTEELRFMPFEEALVTSMSESGDSTFLRLVARELRSIQTINVGTDVKLVGRLHHWVGSFSRLIHQFRALTHRICADGASLSMVPACATAEGDPPIAESLPSIADSPYGPAFCMTAADGVQAISLIDTRLRTNPGLSLSVDLEGLLGGRRGHIDLMQLAVDAVNTGEKQLVFVFDTNNAGQAFLGQGPLRDILQDPAIPKVLHCCYGDCSSLYYEYGIAVQGVFDTGVADCLLRGVGSHKQRRLDRVVTDHVPEVQLVLKDTFKHIPGMFAIRPLPLEYFVYSYEDVLYCNLLFIAMRDALAKQGLLELAWALSSQRAPPAALPQDDVRYQPPSSVAVLLHDKTQMICLQQSGGSIALPCGCATFNEDIRAQATRAWVESVGPLSLAFQSVFTNRMRRPVRIGNVHLVEVIIPDCKLIFPSLRESMELVQKGESNNHVVIQPFESSTKQLPTTSIEQRALFQHVWFRNVGTRTASVQVVLGKKLTSERAALILYDDTHLFCLTTSKAGELQFPSAPIELGLTAQESAIRAFNTYAGPALNKYEDKMTGVSLMPNSSRQIRVGLEAMTEVGTYGHTVYFQAKVPALADLRSSFVAARLPNNGFRLTATLSKRHPDFSLCKHEMAAHLTTYDLEAFSSLFPASYTAAVAQHSGSDIVDESRLSNDQSLYEAAWTEFLEIQQGESLLTEACEASQAGCASVCASESIPDEGESIPEYGADPEYDALFEAAVLVQYSALVGVHCESTTASSAGAQLSEAMGTSPNVTMPTVAEMRTQQRAHPALYPWIDYLEFGEWSTTWQSLAEDDQSQLVKDVEQYFLDESAVLRRRRWKPTKLNTQHTKRDTESGGDGLVIVPPSLRKRIIYQYHDRTAHFGVTKTLKLIMTRFDWGGSTIMRGDVVKHIRHCHPCQLAKMPTNRAGEHQIGDNGQHPNDVLCGDLFHVGIEEDGYDTTLDFACYFSRDITSIALKGVPDSETIVDALLKHVVANKGVPSEIRSDQGSNFISKAVQLLYERMGIRITVGTAYHHQLVALVERWHRTLLQLIKTHRAAVANGAWGSKWYRCLPIMMLAYNATVNPSTGYSPFFLQHLRQARLPSDYQRSSMPELPKELPTWVQARLDEMNVSYDAATLSLRHNALSAKRRYDLRRDVSLWFKPGDSVLVTKGEVLDSNAVKPKMELPNKGPYTVLRRMPYDRYLLADYKTRRFRDTIHVSRLIPYFGSEPEESPRWMVNNSPGDPTGGRWPVHSLIGRRTRVLKKRNNDLALPTGAHVLEYKIRWLGFNKDYDSWRAVQYLSGIVELINEYDQHNPFVPDDMPDGLEVVDRPELPHPEPTEQALSRRHYRAHLNAGPPPALSEQLAVVKPAVELPKFESIEDLRRKLEDSLSRLPVNTRVRVHFPRDDTWWTGTITKSWLPKWRVATKKPAHHVWVKYDDPRYTEPVEHNVQESIIELECETPILGRAKELAPIDLDGKQRARLLRLKRQLL